MKKIINLYEDVEDDFDTNWWEHIRSGGDFVFFPKPDRKELEVDDDDILIHKQLEANEDTGAKFVSKNFFQILDGAAYQIDIKAFRTLIEKCIARYINTHGMYPKGWSLNKVQKKESIAILHLKLSEYDAFNFKVHPGKFQQFSGLGAIVRSEVVDYFTNLPTTTATPISSPSSPAPTRLPKITSAPAIQATAAESGGKIFVTSAKIEEIDQRKSTYQGSDTIYYIIYLKGGSAAGTKGTKKTPAIQRDFEVINARCSEKAKETYSLEVGDVVSFTGRLKNDNYLGLIVQNIRKFVKDEET